ISGASGSAAAHKPDRSRAVAGLAAKLLHVVEAREAPVRVAAVRVLRADLHRARVALLTELVARGADVVRAGPRDDRRSAIARARRRVAPEARARIDGRLGRQRVIAVHVARRVLAAGEDEGVVLLPLGVVVEERALLLPLVEAEEVDLREHRRRDAG